MSHPGEKFDQVSPHINGIEKTSCEIVNDPDGMIFFGGKCRIAINDRQRHRCRSTTKMSTPLGGLSKQITSLKDSFFRLRLIKLFHRACTKSFIGGLAHPTITEVIYFLIARGTSSQNEEGLTYHHIGRMQREGRHS